MKNEFDYLVWFDGSCEPMNPGGTARWGIIIRDANDNIVCKKSGTIGKGKLMSNNVAELAAASEALYEIMAYVNSGESVLMRGDSKLAINLLNRAWKPRYEKKGLYLPYFDMAMKALGRCTAKNVKITIEWVPRDDNQEADDLSKS